MLYIYIRMPSQALAILLVTFSLGTHVLGHPTVTDGGFAPIWDIAAAAIPHTIAGVRRQQ